MGRMTKEKRHDALTNTSKIIQAYHQVVAELSQGKVAVHEISRSNLYKRIAEKTGLCTKSIAYKLNHCV